MAAGSSAETGPVPAAALPGFRRLLVRGVNWLGDAIMATPALERLREVRPDARLTLLTPAKLADLWTHYPHVDAVIPFAAGEGVLTVARRLRAERFDTALVLPNSPRSALEVLLARIPRRVGFARPWRNRFLTERVPPWTHEVPTRKRTVAEIRRLIAADPPPPRAPVPVLAHQVHHYLHLAAALGANPRLSAPRLRVKDEEVQRIRAERFAGPPATADWLGLNAGAEFGPAKRWPVERFVAAAAEVHRRTGAGCVVFGGQNDAALAEELAAGLAQAGVRPAVNLAGRTTLRELCAAMRLCRVVLTNDTGPMHLAAAVGTPVVVPFGSTSPELTGPGLPGDGNSPHRLLVGNVPCAPCFLRECPIDFRCLRGISVDAVVAAVLSVWERAPA